MTTRLKHEIFRLEPEYREAMWELVRLGHVESKSAAVRAGLDLVCEKYGLGLPMNGKNGVGK